MTDWDNEAYCQRVNSCVMYKKASHKLFQLENYKTFLKLELKAVTEEMAAELFKDDPTNQSPRDAMPEFLGRWTKMDGPAGVWASVADTASSRITRVLEAAGCPATEEQAERFVAAKGRGEGRT